ncbi:MAG: hypothetical protein ACRCYS_13820 [Beijerinckiaceae bacterium]
MKLSNLIPFCEASVLNQMDVSKHKRLYAGFCNGCSFIASLDHDDHCEVSLATKMGIPNYHQIEAFFALINHPRPMRATVILQGRGLHWVLSEGALK